MEASRIGSGPGEPPTIPSVRERMIAVAFGSASSAKVHQDLSNRGRCCPHSRPKSIVCQPYCDVLFGWIGVQIYAATQDHCPRCDTAPAYYPTPRPVVDDGSRGALVLLWRSRGTNPCYKRARSPRRDLNPHITWRAHVRSADRPHLEQCSQCGYESHGLVEHRMMAGERQLDEGSTQLQD
jgi:hypothetical protein